MAEAAVRLASHDGRPTVVLEAAGASATFVPTLAGLGCSLVHRGVELLDLHGGTPAFAAGHTTGLPLLHPWANRLGAERFEVGGRRLDLTTSSLVHRDPGGLPIHGTLVGEHELTIERSGVDRRRTAASVALSMRYEGDELLACFPFPHRLVVEHRLGPLADGEGAALEVEVTVESLDEARVPVSFGWHPYLRLPGDRATWVLELPDRRHLDLDDRGLPTGASIDEPAEAEPLADRTFDDAYELTGEPAMGLRSGDRSVRVVFGAGYRFAQVYAPLDPVAVALEPMTARTDALRSGQHPWAEPGGPFSATFRLELR